MHNLAGELYDVHTYMTRRDVSAAEASQFDAEYRRLFEAFDDGDSWEAVALEVAAQSCDVHRAILRDLFDGDPVGFFLDQQADDSHDWVIEELINKGWRPYPDVVASLREIFAADPGDEWIRRVIGKLSRAESCT